MTQAQPSPGQWFWDVQGQKQGPVWLDALQHMARSGAITPDSLVWTTGMPEWMPAGRLPVLFTAAGKPVPKLDGNQEFGGLFLPSGPQSGFAIAAGYCGLIGVLFALTAPLGVIFGILALRDLKQHPEKRGRGRAWTGIIAGGLVTLFWLVIIVAALAVRR